MGKVIDQVFDIYITEETNCSATMYKSILNSRGIEVSDDALRIFSGYSGGVSTENLCGAVIGAVAAFSYLMQRKSSITGLQKSLAVPTVTTLKPFIEPKK